MSQNPIPKIAAHRGLSTSFPENTMAAFEAAAGLGPAYIELDFHRSADGQLMCVHDLKLDRYVKDTRPELIGKTIGQLSLAQLQTIDMGSWKDARYKGQVMPTLQAVLERFAVGHTPADPKLMIEHKSGSATELFELLQRVKPQPDSLAVMSFDWDFLKALRGLDATLPLALLGNGELRDEQINTASDLKAIAMAWNNELTSEAIRHLHDAGLQAWVYTLNHQEQWLNARAMGVDVIVTDCCDVLSALVWH